MEHPLHDAWLSPKIVVCPTGCWIWAAAINEFGYGVAFPKAEGRTRLAHRVTYQMLNGTIPEGLQIDHLCRIRNCVNPSHMELVTPRENTLRGAVACGPLRERKKFCSKGHPRLHFNYGGRETFSCKECPRENYRRYYWRRKERLEASCP